PHDATSRIPVCDPAGKHSTTWLLLSRRKSDMRATTTSLSQARTKIIGRAAPRSDGDGGGWTASSPRRWPDGQQPRRWADGLAAPEVAGRVSSPGGGRTASSPRRWADGLAGPGFHRDAEDPDAVIGRADDGLAARVAPGEGGEAVVGPDVVHQH